MPRLKCVRCGQKKSDFVVCKSCARRFCHDCIKHGMDLWHVEAKELMKINEHRPEPLKKLKIHPGHPWLTFGGCCMKHIEAYVIKTALLEELPLLMGYPWRHNQTLKLLNRRFEEG